MLSSLWTLYGSKSSSMFTILSLTIYFYTLRQILSAATANVFGDYCDTESFRAYCPESEVIFIESARYGRMAIGRCVESEMGYIGCYRDVITMADRRCSGKRSCEIRVPDAEFENTRPCLKELKSYMQVSYRCLPVTNVTIDYCLHHNELNVRSALTASSGYLASIVTSDAPFCARHPWIVRSAPGQRINITLWDFTVYVSHASMVVSGGKGKVPVVLGDSLQSASDSRRKLSIPTERQSISFSETHYQRRGCREYAVVEDGDSRYTICGGETGVQSGTVPAGARGRQGASYLSTSNLVRIWITAGIGPTDMQRFIIEYSMVGCIDPPLAGDASVWFRRSPDGISGVAGCRRSDISWRVVCGKGGVWSGPDGKNCSSKPQVQERRAVVVETSVNEDNSPDFVAVTLISILAIVLTLLVLATTFVVARKRRSRDQKQTPVIRKKVTWSSTMGSPTVYVPRTSPSPDWSWNSNTRRSGTRCSYDQVPSLSAKLTQVEDIVRSPPAADQRVVCNPPSAIELRYVSLEASF